MNIYKELNEIMDYLEEHLEEEIQAKDVAKRIGLNEYTFLRIFSIICNTTFSEYIRNRRLSNAGQEIFLNGGKIVDIAVKYQYNNATAFSRAFERFHGIKPSQVKDNSEKLKLVAKMHFNEDNECKQDIDYKIIEMKELVLYGIYKKTTNEKIKQDAPKFYIECQDKFGMAPYALVKYSDKERRNVKSYWVLYEKKLLKEFEKVVIPESKWIQIRVDSQEAKDIQKISDFFYDYFLPSSKYNYRELPEIEYYHDDITDFLIPIE